MCLLLCVVWYWRAFEARFLQGVRQWPPRWLPVSGPDPAALAVEQESECSEPSFGAVARLALWREIRVLAEEGDV
jgi:hypothetical protein